MTGQDLCEKLKASGTGEGKLAVIREILRGNPDIKAADLVIDMSRAGLAVGTVDKAKRFLDEEMKLEQATAPSSSTSSLHHAKTGKKE